MNDGNIDEDNILEFSSCENGICSEVEDEENWKMNNILTNKYIVK